ncbi:hypothetical protein [Pseudomonas alloputida]|uniref:hypothetical protein n=1 Tax=Pseudomonas alloputida TaxID=1940621 RepID=UPI00386E42EE
MQSYNDSRFSGYVARRTLHNEELLEGALRILDPNKFDDLTSYCKALSVIVSELRSAKASKSSSPYYNCKSRPQAYTTLLRNPTYRSVIENRFANKGEVVVQSSKDNLEELRWELTRLQAENNLLMNKVAQFDSANFCSHGSVEVDQTVVKLQRQLMVLLKAYKGVRLSCRGVVDERYDDELNSNAIGLFGIYGLIVDGGELKEINNALKELPAELKSDLESAVSKFR